MADFTEPQIQGMLKALRDDMGYPATRELAILELEDMKRKGCLCERTDGYCIGCSAMAGGSGNCPMNDWEKRHPEYKNDELATKIKILEAGGEEAYKAKLKAQEESRKKAEEEAQKATDADRANACRYLLNLFYKSKLTATEGGIIDLVNNILWAKTKSEIWDEVAKTA